MLENIKKYNVKIEAYLPIDENPVFEDLKIITLKAEIDEFERQLQEAHVDRLTRGECDAETGMIYTDVVSNIERVADHSTNIAFSIMTDVKKPDMKD